MIPPLVRAVSPAIFARAGVHVLALGMLTSTFFFTMALIVMHVKKKVHL